MQFLKGSTKTNLQMLFYKDFDRWQRIFEDLVFLKNPNSWVFIIEPYEGSKVVSKLSAEERKSYDMDKELFDSILACLPTAEVQWYKNMRTSFDLWDALAQAWKRNDKSKGSDEEVKKELLKKEDELKVLQSQVLNMETEREEMRSKIAQTEEKILELQSQQTELIKLKEDHSLALQTIQDLQRQLSQDSHSTKQPEKVGQPAKVVKKVYASKSSCEKKISQFTNYSLQKNKKYSKKSQSTHKKVDFWDSVKVERRQKKTKRASASTQPSEESRHTKSCAYTRAQMFALAPSRTVIKQPKDFVFVPFSQRKTPSQSIPRQQFRSETPRFFSRWNSISLDYVDTTYRWLSGLSKSVGTTLRWVPKVVAT